MKALADRRDRHGGPADEGRRGLEQPREHVDHRLQRPPRRFRRPALPADGPPRHASRPQDGTMLPTGVQIGLGVRPAAVSVVIGTGHAGRRPAAISTSRSRATAISRCTLPSGRSAYTRDGALKRSADGLIVTSDGYPVVPGITIPADARGLSINAVGRGLCLFRRPGGAGAAGPADPRRLSQRKGAGGDRVEPLPRKPGLGRRRSRGRPGRTGWARCGRAIWRKARSMPCAR